MGRDSGSRKAKVVSKVGVVCFGCGCVLTKDNKSFDSCLCKTCFDVDMAELVDEDMREDSMTDAERLAEFIGY
jgi:hypothetical protein